MAATTIFQQSQHIACYLACQNEFDCTAIIQKAWQENKNIYLPVLSEHAEKTLEFACYREETTLKLNRYNILEPAGSATIPLTQLDLILLPLVGFDLQRNRLGMGGGYYDRTLDSFLSNSRHCVLLGVAFEAQQIENLPHDPWDVPLDGVITEKKTHLFFPSP